MKAKHIYNLAAAVLMAGLVSCQEKAGVAPVALNASSIYAEAQEGQVTLHWDIPSNADYHYVQVNYTLPEDEFGNPKECMRTASIYADEMVIDGLLARYGAIEYTIRTVSYDGTPSPETRISAQCLPVQPAIAFAAEGQVPVDGIWATKGEQSEGPVEALIDGRNDTFFHSNWSWYIWQYDEAGNKYWVEQAPDGMPVIVVVKLARKIEAFKFFLKNRNNGNMSNPGTIELYVGNAFNWTNIDETVPAYGNRLIDTVTGLPAAQAAEYTSPVIYDGGEPFQYVWFKITELTRTNIDYVAMSRLEITEYSVSIDDPEAK